ncbi:MAG TPA: FGGY family carbohydrate kinase [Chryseosolibacter sp.]
MTQYLLGLDIGSSSIKASLVNASTGGAVATAQSPSEEMPMIAVNPGWAEQDPDMWWNHAVICIQSLVKKSGIDPKGIEAIGISYQMHGLVVVDKNLKPLRPSIIWCDSRAVPFGDAANKALGESYCLEHFLNSPGNFTAAKLKWVQTNEPKLYESIHKFMLPGDYITLKLSGEIVTTDSSLSEGIFWDYKTKSVSEKLLSYYGFSKSLVPELKPVFSVHAQIRKDVAAELGLSPNVRISYTSGDQPNNAFSLNVLNAGETAATAGTSGVIYSVTDKNAFDAKSRVNTFVHVNNTADKISNGVLLCINGTGILNSWLRKNTKSTSEAYPYEAMNAMAARVPIGAEGLSVLPFGNGAERILENREIGATFQGLNFNRHGQQHIFRAAQEGIVFSLRYGFDILQKMGLKTNVIRAGNANMFLSPLFREAFVNTIGSPLELYNTDGATGAAIGAGVGAGLFADFKDAFKGLKVIGNENPDSNKIEKYQAAYEGWKRKLEAQLSIQQ